MIKVHVNKHITDTKATT